MPSELDQVAGALSPRYRVLREVGSGGSATVFEAEDTKHRRRVALKVLRAELAAALGTERFLREIELTANLQHPHIVPLYDSGEADGLLYYIMPLVEGETLRARLARRGRLNPEEAIAIAADVAAALDYAHGRNVVHRDVKPANIMLQEGRAAVADFGIALAVAEARMEERLTGTGYSIGTPGYMSPEQAMWPREAAPWNFVSRITTPTIVINGKADIMHPYEEGQVPFFEAIDVPPEDKEFQVSEVGHIPPWPEVIRHTLGWLDRRLGPAKPQGGG